MYFLLLSIGNRVERALPNQIVFYDDENGRPPVMTWRYPVPRFLNEVVIMPIPFHVDEVMPGDESAEVFFILLMSYAQIVSLFLCLQI